MPATLLEKVPATALPGEAIRCSIGIQIFNFKRRLPRQELRSPRDATRFRRDAPATRQARLLFAEPRRFRASSALRTGAGPMPPPQLRRS
jgi:hypothetical protein